MSRVRRVLAPLLAAGAALGQGPPWRLLQDVVVGMERRQAPLPTCGVGSPVFRGLRR